MEVCIILGSEGQANKLARSHCAHLGQHVQLAFESEAGSIDGVRAHNFLLPKVAQLSRIRSRRYCTPVVDMEAF